MLKWPKLAVAAALAIGLHPAAGSAQETDLIFAIPVQSLTVTFVILRLRASLPLPG